MGDTELCVSQQMVVSSTGDFGTPRRDFGTPRRSTQFIAVLSVALGAFALGNALGWTSPADRYLGIANKTEEEEDMGFNDSEKSWIGSTMPLGATLAVVPVGIALDAFGRKKTMLALALPFTIGWLLIAFAKDELWMYLPGRFITGAMGGASLLAATAYISEIADDGVRGMLGNFYQLIIAVGILFVYALGAAKVSVPVITYICAGVPVLFALTFFFMPETPAYQLKKKDVAGARKSLHWFRGDSYNVDEELRVLKEGIDKADAEQLSFKEAFSTRAAKKGLVITIGLMVFQQMGGINVVTFYASDIFKQAGSNVEPDVSSMIVGAVQVVATVVSTLVVDRLGRRILLVISDSIMSACGVLMAVYFFIYDSDPVKAQDIGWLPLASLCIFMVAFPLGYGPIPWTMLGELFPSNIKARASSIACATTWLLTFVVTKFFSDINKAIGGGPTFCIFAGASAIGTVFVLTIVPETKGKSVAEIQNELAGTKKDPAIV